MEHWYYEPWQYELREALEPVRVRATIATAARFGIPPMVTGTVLAGGLFLAYTPLLQPGPPAKIPTPYTLPVYRLGGGMVV